MCYQAACLPVEWHLSESYQFEDLSCHICTEWNKIWLRNVRTVDDREIFKSTFDRYTPKGFFTAQSLLNLTREDCKNILRNLTIHPKGYRIKATIGDFHHITEAPGSSVSSGLVLSFPPPKNWLISLKKEPVPK